MQQCSAQECSAQAGLLTVLAYDFSDIFLDFISRRHHFMTATPALYFEIHSHTQHIELLGAAGVLLLHFKYVPHSDVQTNHLQSKNSCFLPVNYTLSMAAFQATKRQLFLNLSAYDAKSQLLRLR